MEINVMGEAGDEGQAEKGRRERRRQKAAFLSGPAFHHQPLLVPCSVHVRTSGSMFSSDKSVWAPSGFCLLGVAGSIPDRCLCVWRLRVVPAALVWVLGPPSTLQRHGN